MRLLAPAALALLVVFSAAEVANAQSRTGRASGSTGRTSSGSAEGRIGSTAGRASTGSGRVGSMSGRSASERAAVSSGERSRGSTEGRATGSTGIGSRNGSSTWSGTYRSQGTAGQDRGRTAVPRGTATTTSRGIAGRTGIGSGVASQSGRSDGGVVYGPPLRGSAVGTGYRDYGYYDRDRYRPYDPRSYYRRARIYPVWPVTLIRTCPFSFGFGWGGGFACFQTHFTGGFFVPLIYSYPTTVINVHTRSSYVSPAVRYDIGYEDSRCAIVSVITPGNDGYWKTLRLPANGATTREQLQRLISNRLAEGYPFLITDADGVRIEVPAGIDLERVTVDPCR